MDPKFTSYNNLASNESYQNISAISQKKESIDENKQEEMSERLKIDGENITQKERVNEEKEVELKLNKKQEKFDCEKEKSIQLDQKNKQVQSYSEILPESCQQAIQIEKYSLSEENLTTNIREQKQEQSKEPEQKLSNNELKQVLEINEVKEVKNIQTVQCEKQKSMQYLPQNDHAYKEVEEVKETQRKEYSVVFQGEIKEKSQQNENEMDLQSLRRQLFEREMKEHYKENSKIRKVTRTIVDEVILEGDIEKKPSKKVKMDDIHLRKQDQVNRYIGEIQVLLNKIKSIRKYL